MIDDGFEQRFQAAREMVERQRTKIAAEQAEPTLLHVPDMTPTALRSLTGPLMDIVRERQRQDAKWGQQNHDARDWFIILAEEFGEVAREVCQFVPPQTAGPETTRRLATELIEVAAVCVAWVECIEREAAW